MQRRCPGNGGENVAARLVASLSGSEKKLLLNHGFVGLNIIPFTSICQGPYVLLSDEYGSMMIDRGAQVTAEQVMLVVDTWIIVVVPSLGSLS